MLYLQYLQLLVETCLGIAKCAEWWQRGLRVVLRRYSLRQCRYCHRPAMWRGTATSEVRIKHSDDTHSLPRLCRHALKYEWYRFEPNLCLVDLTMFDGCATLLFQSKMSARGRAPIILIPIHHRKIGCQGRPRMIEETVRMHSCRRHWSFRPAYCSRRNSSPMLQMTKSKL